MFHATLEKLDTVATDRFGVMPDPEWRNTTNCMCVFKYIYLSIQGFVLVVLETNRFLFVRVCPTAFVESMMYGTIRMYVVEFVSRDHVKYLM